MTELSKIRKNGVDYNLKDTAAREAIEELKQSGTGNGSGGNVDGAVLYTEQTLTKEQKKQARLNIGAMGSDYEQSFEEQTFVNDGSSQLDPAKAKWAMYFDEEIEQIEILPKFNGTDGTYTWERYTVSEIADNAGLTLVVSGSLNVGEAMVFDNITPTDVIAIQSSGPAPLYMGKTNAKYSARLAIVNGASDGNGYVLGSVGAFSNYVWVGTFVKRIYAEVPLSAKVSELEERVGEIEKGLYTGVKWAVFGDSLTERNHTATKIYHDYISDQLGIEVVNYGKSGTGYKSTYGEFAAFYDRILTIDPNSFDVLTIFGSGNDLNQSFVLGVATDTGTDTLCGCINTTIDNFYSVAPFKKLALITPTPWKSYSPAVENNAMEAYSEKIVEICKRRGIPCLDLYHMSGLRPWDEAYRTEFYNENGIQDSGVHPNSKGHKMIAPIIREFLKKLI